MAKRRRWWLVGAAAALVAGVAILYGVSRFTAQSDSSSGSVAPIEVVRGNISVTVPASGQFEPTTSTTVRPDPNLPQRQVTSVLVKVGDRVEAGQVVATLDSSGLDINLSYANANYLAQKAKLDLYRNYTAKNNLVQAESSLAQARLTLQSAQAAFDGMVKLADQELASKASLLDAENALHNAQAAVQNAQNSVDSLKGDQSVDELQQLLAAVAEAESTLRTDQLIYNAASIRTPVSGIVSAVGVSVGDLVSATSVVTASDSGSSTVSQSSSICTVVNNDPEVLQALIDESDISRVRVGQHATVTPVAYPNEHIDGIVTSISQEAVTSSNVTTITAYISVPNADGRILTGMNADAAITVSERKDVLMLPASVITKDGNGGAVRVEAEGNFVTRHVELGVTDGTHTEILSGVRSGELVFPVSTAKAANQTPGRPSPLLGGPGLMH